MGDYNLGNVNIEFNTNKIFLLMQMLYRLQSIEAKIHSDNRKVSYLADSIKNFIKIIEKNRQGLKEFNIFKENAENKNMWAEYSEYINSFAQLDMKELQVKNPEIAEVVKELINTDFFVEVEKLNNQYSIKMEERFVNQTIQYKQQIENIIGKTKTKKIIYMPFTPELFSIEPCCLSDKNGNGEFAVQFTIPTDESEFEKNFEMQYTEGLESVILFHEQLHAHLPTKRNENFKNSMQRELDSHLKHAIIELLANGEMGIEMAHHSNCFQSIFHIGQIQYNGKTLTTDDLETLGMKDNELLHTEATEKYKNYEGHFSKEELGILKIRGMMYPYTLMYKNRNNEQQLETVSKEIQRDAQVIEKIYGNEFLKKVQDGKFLEQVQKVVEPYNSLLEFAEGMSKELLGIEQIKIAEKVDKRDNINLQNPVKQHIFNEQEIGKTTIGSKTTNKDRALLQIQKDEHEMEQENKRGAR